MSSHPFLDFTLEGFRCFRDRVEFRETRHVNVICGPNNSGKSSLLLPIRLITTAWHPLARPYHGGTFLGGDNVGGIRFRPEDINHESELFQLIFHRATPDAVGGGALLEGRVAPNPAAVVVDVFDAVARLDGAPQSASTRRMLSDAIGRARGSIVCIPAGRRIEPFLHEEDLDEPGESSFSGSALLPMVLGYANSPMERSGHADCRHPKLAAIEKKMSTLMAQTVAIRPLPVQRDIELTIDGRHVALSRSGAGIGQLLVLSAALVEHPHALLLIEEPENFRLS
jgi:hypothetical protein